MNRAAIAALFICAGMTRRLHKSSSNLRDIDLEYFSLRGNRTVVTEENQVHA